MGPNKFEEIELPRNSELVIKSYQHVDNGGHYIGVDIYGGLHIATGNFGYSETSVMMATIDIDGLIDILQKAKERLKELEVISRLKGE